MEAICPVCRRPTTEPAAPGVIVMHEDCSRAAHHDAHARLRWDDEGNVHLASPWTLCPRPGATHLAHLIRRHGPQTLAGLAVLSDRSEHAARLAIAATSQWFELRDDGYHLTDAARAELFAQTEAES